MEVLSMFEFFCNSNKVAPKKWQGYVKNGYFVLDGYKGNTNHVIVPNDVDFRNSGVDIQDKQVAIDPMFVEYLISQGCTNLEFSNIDAHKIKALGKDWKYAFSGRVGFSGKPESTLKEFDGSGLDVSGIQDMSSMFENNELQELKGVSDWNVSHVVFMTDMFDNNKLRSVEQLSNWNTSSVAHMNGMFCNNELIDLTPLKNWNVRKVTNVEHMFANNKLTNVNGLSNWNVTRMKYMQGMFENNNISDLSGIAAWNVQNAFNMSSMFNNNNLTDESLKSIANWDVCAFLDGMFGNNSIENYDCIKHWREWAFDGKRDVYAVKPHWKELLTK